MGTEVLVGLGVLVLVALAWVAWELRSAPFEHELWPSASDQKTENKTLLTPEDSEGQLEEAGREAPSRAAERG